MAIALDSRCKRNRARAHN